MTYEKISPPITPDFPDEWYDLNQASHFWFAWRIRVLEALLKDQKISRNAPLRALEIGCGVGLLRSQLETLTAWTVDGVDLNEAALQNAHPSRGRTLLYNICERKPEFQGSFDVVILFDVIEHIKAPDVFLQAAAWHLKPGGILLVNVPALGFLYSRYDVLVGHFQRYTASSFQKFLMESSPELTLLDQRYWGFSLVPLVWLRKMLMHKVKTSADAIDIGFKAPTQWLNQLLLYLMHVETRMLKHPILGSSLTIAAQKTNKAE